MLRSSGINFMKFGHRLALKQSLDLRLRVATPRLLSDVKITKAKKKPSIATSKPGVATPWSSLEWEAYVSQCPNN